MLDEQELLENGTEETAEPSESSAERIAREREEERRARLQHRKARRVIRDIEVMLKGTKYCRYHLVYLMQALDTIISSVALRRPAGSASARLDGQTLIVEVENPALTSSNVRDMVDRALKDMERFNLAKALLEMDDFEFVVAEEGGVTLRVKRRIDR